MEQTAGIDGAEQREIEIKVIYFQRDLFGL